VPPLSDALPEPLRRKLLRLQAACCQLPHALLAASENEQVQLGLLAGAEGGFHARAAGAIEASLSTAGTLAHLALLDGRPEEGSGDGAAADRWDRWVGERGWLAVSGSACQCASLH